jgi:peptidoglycan DL-endopeptidase CwlO
MRAGADPVSNSQSNLNQVTNELQGAQAQATQIESQLQSDGAKLDVLAQQYETAQQQVQQLDTQLDATKEQIAQTQARVQSTVTRLRNEAIKVYVSGTTEEQFDTLFSGGGEDAAVTQEYQRLAGASMSNTIDVLHQQQQALGVQESQLQTTENQARTAVDQAAAAKQQAQSVTDQQQAALGQVKGQVATLLAQQSQAKQAVAAAEFQQQQAAQAAAEAAAPAQAPGGQGGGGQGFGGGGSFTNVAVSPGAGGAVQAAESQLGVPYVWGGESPRGSPDPGFDCSGLTQWSWRQAGVGLPRTAQEQYDAIAHVALSALQPGDLLFWDDGTSSVQHVGMYVGGGDVIDAPQTGEVVQIQPIWTSGLVGAGRP